MIWFFERQQRRLHYEIRRQTDGDDYEIVISHPDGRLEVERFSDPAALLARSSALHVTLLNEGWVSPSEARRTDRSASLPTTSFPG